MNNSNILLMMFVMIMFSSVPEGTGLHCFTCNDAGAETGLGYHPGCADDFNYTSISGCKHTCACMTTCYKIKNEVYVEGSSIGHIFTYTRGCAFSAHPNGCKRTGGIVPSTSTGTVVTTCYCDDDDYCNGATYRKVSVQLTLIGLMMFYIVLS
ncbi:unnamed protein product [Owenia fusiformis]|uniref:Uncharacterized protein n=1 Tax=Owenia fusiformis TaxID=6347 RepID=A0A8J1UQC4_OWEFU|nr:unnamed protein product [Owenia fusiformis]